MALSAAQLKLLDAHRKTATPPPEEEEEEAGLSQGQLRLLGRADDQDPNSSPYLEAVDKASRNDPDKMIEAIALEQETGLPTEIIDEDPEEAKRQAWVKANGLDMESDENSPETTRWLSDTDNATVAKDDYSNLRDIEKAVRRQEAYEGMEFQDLGNIVESWAIGIPKMGAQLAYWMAQNPDDPVNQTQKMMMEEAVEAGDQKRIDELNEKQAISDENMADLKDYIETASKLQQDLAPQGDILAEAIHGGGTMILDYIPGFLTSILTKGRYNPTLGFLTAKVSAESSFEALSEDWTFAESTRYAFGQGGLEYVWERTPVKMMEKIVGDLGGTGAVRGTLKRWAAIDLGTEQGAELTQSIHSYIVGLDHEMSAAESWGERAEIQARRQYVVLLSTVIGTGGISTTVKALDLTVGRRQRANREAMKKAFGRTNSEQSQSGLDQLFSLAQSSKTNERDAAYLEDHINRVAPDGKIFLSADAVDTMDVIPDYIEAQLDGSRADIVIPLSRFVRDFAGDAAKLNEVRRYIKTAGHLQTLDELEANTDSVYIKRVIDEAAKAKDTKDEADRIYDQIVQQMVDTGRHSPLTARQSAQLVPAVITTHYEELKKEGKTNPDGSEITLVQLFEDMGLKIVGPEAEVGSKEFMDQETPRASVVEEGSVTLEDGRTYHKDPAYADESLVMVDAELLEEIWGEEMKVGPGPEFKGQLGNRIEQYKAFLEQQDGGTFVNRAGETKHLPPTDLLVGSAVVNIPLGFDGYLAFGDGRHRARAMMEAGFKQIPMSMSEESLANLERIIAGPGVLSQSDLSNITIEETVVDEDGNLVVLKESALSLYQVQQGRMAQVEQLRECVGG